jgi:hypothetical protein
MLGRFLELSVAAHPLGELFEFYRALGFSELPSGDIITHPYAVVHDDQICIGLHDRNPEEPRLAFIRPDLKHYLHALRRQRIEIESAKLADDEFNELTFRDPCGQLIVLVEAQTFSPGAWQDCSGSICGRFLEYSVQTDSRSSAAEFWQPLGFSEAARGETPHPWIRLTGHGLTIGFHETAQFAPGVSFTTKNLDARLAFIQAKGIDGRRDGTTTRGLSASATLAPPGGTPLYLFDERGVPGP